MPPKRKADGSTPSIIDAFKTVRKQPKLNRSAFSPNEVIDISESQEDEPGPSTSTVTPPPDTKSTVGPVRKWTPGEKKPMGRMSSSARRYMAPVVSDSDLRGMGCEVDELRVMEASADLECIEEDVQIVRQLISSNCALILPKRAIFIVSMFIRNWLRIMPTGRIMICSSEQQWYEALQEECSMMGIDKSSFTQLSQSKIPPASRIMIATSKILLRVTTSDPLASEIRCVIIHLSGTEISTNLKSTINEMLMKKVASRIIVVGGGGSKGGSTGAISRKQRIITTTHLSHWIEPNEESFTAVLKPRLQPPVRVWTWNESDNPFLVEAVDQLEEAIKELLAGSGMGSVVEGKSPRDLIYAPLGLLPSQSGGRDDCILLISLLSHLFSFGKEAFEKRLAVVSSESADLEMRLLSCLPFTRLLSTVSELEGHEHRKIKLVKDIIHKAAGARKGGNLRAVILVESPPLVTAMADCLAILCGTMQVGIYPLGSPQFPLSRGALILQSGGIAIISIDNQNAINAFQSIVSSPVHLVISTSRRSAIAVENATLIGDWHLILHESRERIRGVIEEEWKGVTHQRVDTAFSLNNYPFNYERSELSLDVSSAVIRLSTEKGRVHRCNGVSLNPTERALLSSRGITWMDSRLPLTLTPSALLWNESIHSSHPSSLTRRLVSCISPFFPPPLPPLPPPRPSLSLPCSCTHSDGEVFYSSLVSKLSHLFT